MGLIKKNKIEDKGTLALIERSIEIQPSLEMSEELTRRQADDNDFSAYTPDLGAAKALAAEKQSLTIIEEARNEAEEIREQARTDGLEEGKQEGRAELAARIEEAMDTVSQAVTERKKIIKDAESEILRLSLKVAEQIIRSEVSLHRDVCLNIVSEAIQRVSDREQIIVRVSHEDVDQLKRHKDRIAGLADGVKSFSILEDTHVEPGGCIIETNLGFVDARINTKITAIEEAFKRSENADE